MRQIAILGAGELGGLVAHALARRHLARAILLVDERDRVAEGKALDIAQAAPVEGFAAQLSGTSDFASASGADVVVLADRASGGEWQGADAMLLLKPFARGASPFVICAGAQQRDLVERGVVELGLNRHRLLGSAPEALVSGARALVALAADGSPRDVAIAILGVPPTATVIAWHDATIGGYALTRLLDEPTRRTLSNRITALWPPGPLALATACAKTLDALQGHSRQTTTCFVAPDHTAGTKTRAAAVPVRLGPGGMRDIALPSLSAVEQTAFESAVML